MLIFGTIIILINAWCAYITKRKGLRVNFVVHIVLLVFGIFCVALPVVGFVGLAMTPPAAGGG